MSVLRYVSHPEVVIDPDVPVPQWGLSETGRRRATAMLAQPWLPRVGHLVCSGEQKALDTAAIVGAHLSLEPEVRHATHENERAGYLPHEAFHAAAAQFFARPTDSVHGWERAVDAQARILIALDDVVHDDFDADTLVIGHGGVGTLLYCALGGFEIDARHDQPGVGHYLSYDRTASRLVHGWRPIDVIAAP